MSSSQSLNQQLAADFEQMSRLIKQYDRDGDLSVRQEFEALERSMQAKLALLNEAWENAATDESRPEEQRPGSARVLVIDDNDMVRKMLRNLLTHAGYQTVDAADGEEGVRVYRQEPADLVVTDVFVPVKDGLEVIRELRRDFPGLKVIALFSHDPSSIPKAMGLGASYIFAKPFRMQKFLDAVEKLVPKHF